MIPVVLERLGDDRMESRPVLERRHVQREPLRKAGDVRWPAELDRHVEEVADVLVAPGREQLRGGRARYERQDLEPVQAQLPRPALDEIDQHGQDVVLSRYGDADPQVAALP